MAGSLESTVRKFIGRLLIVWGLLLYATVGVADGMDSARTNVIKAGMINGFTAYTSWPENHEQSTFTIGVMGADQQFLAALERFFKKKQKVQGKPLSIRQIDINGVRDCQVVVILGEANAQADAIIAAIDQRPILTISDSHDFTASGGHVNFFRENNKLRFKINWRSTTRSQLKVSSRLLRLATVVGEKP